MINEKIGIKIIDLRIDARDEVYEFIDRYYKPMAKNSDGTINTRAHGLVDNDIDALRHSYVSAVYVIEYGQQTADLLGRINELVSAEMNPQVTNMDLWNNSIGRLYGKRAKRGKELFDLLLKALKNGELIITPEDFRKYKGEKAIIRPPKSFVIKIKESKTGENVEFFDFHKKIVMTKEEFISAIREGKYPRYAIRKHQSGEFPYSTRDKFKFNNLG
jgi:hypothetical protein